MTNSQEHISARTVTRAGIATIVLCFLVATFEGIDLQAAGVAAPRIGPAFHLTPGQLGLFFSASAIGLLFGAGAGGRAADWIGRKPALIVSLVVFGLGSLATAQSGSLLALVGSRALTGLGLGGALPVVVALVVENANPRWRNAAVGLTYAGFPIGGALISIIGAGIATWKPIFLVGGLAPLLLAPALWLWLPESSEFRGQMAADRPLDSKRAPARVLFGKTTMLLWASFFLTLLTLYSLLNWLPSLLVWHGLSRSDASLVQIAFNGGGAIGSVGLGALMDSRHRGVTVIVVYAGIALGLIWLANIPGALLLGILAGGFVGLALVGAQTILYGLAPRCYPTAVRGRGVGAAVVVGRLGSILGPLLAAALIGHGGGMGVVWQLVPLVAIAAVCTVLVVGRTQAAA